MSVNVLLIKAFEQMQGYIKFMKDLFIKKMIVFYEPTDNLHYYSAISMRSLVQKKSDQGAFALACTIGARSISKHFVFLGKELTCYH